ncbi:MAG: AAA family ATPase [Sphingobium sp.]
MIKGYISRIKFSGGLCVDLSNDSLFVIIGPNNAGKSATLAEIRDLVSSKSSPTLLLSDLELVRNSSLDDIRAQLSPAKNEQGNYNIAGHHFADGSLNHWWSEAGGGIGGVLTTLLISNLDTRSRLGDCDPPASFNARNRHAADHPFQRMYADDSLEQKTSSAVKRAFKRDLVIHRAASQNIPAYIGDRPKKSKGEESISRSYLDRLEKLDQLEKQGDGIRSFVSIVGRVITENRSIQLIDEPEAFLHPPQARLVAEIVASEAGGRQTFIATHSSDILQGLLGSHPNRVSVVRLARTKNGGRADLLTSADIETLWRDPILRFGKVLDGLFHDGVVVTEADGDCRFYETIMAASTSIEQRNDLHYTYSGGKERIPVLVKALRCLKVPVATIVDFDVLNAENPLRRIVDAHGGDWSKIEPDWTALKNSVEEGSAFVSGDKFKEQIKKILIKIPPGGIVPKDILAEVKKLTRNASPWDFAKNSGLRAINTGQSTRQANALLSSLKALGIFVAPFGQMEGFCRTLDMKGSRWVEEVLRRDLCNDPELADARTFVAEIAAYLGDTNGASPKHRRLSRPTTLM